MTHQISERELDEWLCQPQWKIFASSAGRDGSKRLEVDGAANTRVFRVTVCGEVAFLGADKTAAVAAYNAA
jgi:hypothetical protein